MGLPVLLTPNYVRPKATTFTVTVGGGDWTVASPVTELKDKFFINNAISTDDAILSTKMEFDLGVSRDIKGIVVANSNTDADGKIQIESTDTIAWSGFTANGASGIGDTTLTVNDGTGTPVAGQIFSIAGDTTIYQVVSFVSGTITLKRDAIAGTGLVSATSGAEVITSHSGDYTTPVIDTGLVKYRSQIFGVGDLLWGQSGVWDGLESSESIEATNAPNPFIHLESQILLSRYVRISIENTTNPDTFISVDAVYVSSGFIPEFGYSIGATFGIISNTSSEESPGGVEIFSEENSQRFMQAKIQNQDISTVFQSMFDIHRILDVSEDLFVIFDEDDTTLMTRRAFPARFPRLDPIVFSFPLKTDITVRFKEKIA